MNDLGLPVNIFYFRHIFCYLMLQDTFRMHGAKAYRHLYLFEKVLIIAKKKEDGNLLVKESIQVRNNIEEMMKFYMNLSFTGMI